MVHVVSNDIRHKNGTSPSGSVGEYFYQIDQFFLNDHKRISQTTQVEFNGVLGQDARDLVIGYLNEYNERRG